MFLDVCGGKPKNSLLQALTPGSEWQAGQAWMRLPKGQMPIKTAAQVTLTSEEKRQAATELRANDVRKRSPGEFQWASSQRTLCAQQVLYLVDPCKYSWSKVVRIVARAMKFVAACRSARQLPADQKKRTGLSNEDEVRVVSLAPGEVAAA